MHYGISFEQLDKRTVVLCTEPFEVTVKNIARMLGLPVYPFVRFERPISSRPLSEIKTLAEAAYNQALPILMEA